MKHALAATILTIACLVPTQVAAANTWGTDVSDLWWNPNESGWGANVAHQGEVVFLTLFVYGPDGKAKWYVGPALTSMGGSSRFTFKGDLYETTGPYFAGSFNPASVGLRIVGSATMVFRDIDFGTLTYTVDGVSVSKSIERQTFRTNNLAGSYIGAGIFTATGCGSNSGTSSVAGQFQVSHSGNAIAIASTSGSVVCTYSGIYTQRGRMGTIEGTNSCNNGSRATFSAYEIEASYQGFFLRYTANYGGGCTETGRIVGMK